MLVVLDSNPLGARAIQNVAALREALTGLLQPSGLRSATISLAGDTALAEGLVSNTTSDLWRIGLAAIVVNLLLLVIFLRALIAPLYLLACSVLALCASLGTTVWVFDRVMGADRVTFYVPFATAVLLVSLGSDYNIFGVGHVSEEARRRPLREAIIVAVPQSTRAINAAAVTLAASFGVLALIPLHPSARSASPWRWSSSSTPSSSAPSSYPACSSSSVPPAAGPVPTSERYGATQRHPRPRLRLRREEGETPQPISGPRQGTGYDPSSRRRPSG
jgi:hypothetical protein